MKNHIFRKTLSLGAARVAMLSLVVSAVAPLVSSGVTAKIADWHGAPAIVVDGKPVPPMLMTMTEWDIYDRDRPYFRRLGEAGMRVFFIMCRTDWLLPPDPKAGEPGGVERARRALKLVLEEVPDALVVLRLVASPPVDWVNAHPEEQILYSDGSHRPTDCSTCSHLPAGRAGPLDGMYSMSSEKWRVREEREIASFLAELRKLPQYDRVIGVFLGSGSTSEWGHAQVLHTEDGAYGDFSEPFRAEYEKILRAKYGTVENLRRAWRRPDATFEKPLIPNLAEREYELGTDERIALALTYREGSVAAEMPRIDRDAKGPHHVGTFLDVDRDRHVEDFFLAWNEAIANTVLRFARAVKAADPKLLVGAFYGGLGCCNYHDGGTQTGTLKLLDSPDVDFLANPGTYDNREVGHTEALRTVYDSYALRNKIFLNESDVRTHRSESFGEDDLRGWQMWGCMDLEDSLNVLKRGFGCVLAAGIQAWWFDMGGNLPYAAEPPRTYYYDDPGILRLFAAQQEIAKAAYRRDRTKRNEIAIIVDLESIHASSRFHDRLLLDYYRATDIPRIGAPVDFYFQDDLANPRMPDYRLYVMLNCSWLTAAEREAVRAKARRNGAAVLWTYAPGFIDPEAERRMSAENVSKTVGMTVRMEERTFEPYFRVNRRAHPLLARASNGLRYGVLDREIHSNTSGRRRVFPTYVNPAFYVDDPSATTLGRFCANGRTALAVKETDGVRNIYCAAPVVRSDLLASIAAGVGCHVYTTRDDVLYANEDYVTLHATGDGVRTVRFKRRCSPYEVYEKRHFARDVTELAVEMKDGQTYTWFVGKP